LPNAILTDAIDRLASGEDLSADDAARVLVEIMEGNASEAQSAAFLIALRAKGETVQEVAGLARTMRALAVPVQAGEDLVDTAGTGGGRPTFNVSTTAAFVAAGAGCRVAKHGNRSSTPRRWLTASTPSASALCSPRFTIRPCGTWCRFARSSASVRSSTSSAR
jgi:anthranilate phosphoribosyltransferase